VPTALSDEELDVLIERFDALVGRSLRRAVRAGTSEALTASVKFHQVHDQRTHGHGDVKSVDASSSEALHDAAQAHFKETASDDVKRSRLQYMGGGYEGINRSLRGHREMDANSATAISGMDEVSSDTPASTQARVLSWSKTASCRPQRMATSSATCVLTSRCRQVPQCWAA
jgi:hypothetical protein